ncbi:MAG TPA: hypothetical protein VMU37_04420 [Caulobacteraceae bacterium]|nr:hypothetical protein [Caulobacteraceae bacterium]
MATPAAGPPERRAFLADPDAQSLFAVRHATTTTTTSKLVLVDGCV